MRIHVALISVALYFIAADVLVAQNDAKTKETYRQADALLESKQNIGFIEDPLQVRNAFAPMLRDLLNAKVDGAEYLRRLDFDHESFVYDKKRRLCLFIVGNKIYLKSREMGSSLDGLEFNASHFKRIEKKDDAILMNLALSDNQKAKNVFDKYGLEYQPVLQVKVRCDTLLSAAPSNLRTLFKDGKASIFSHRDGKAVPVLKPTVVLAAHADGNISSLARTPDGRWLLTGSTDSTAKLWDLKSLPMRKTPTAVLVGHKRDVASVAVSADGKRAVTGSDDGTARVWDLTSRKTTMVLPAGRTASGPGFPGSGEKHPWPLNRVALSPGGRWLVTGDIRRSALLWDLDSEDAASKGSLIELRGTAMPSSEGSTDVPWIATSPDGRWAVTGCGMKERHWASKGVPFNPDHDAKLWDLKAEVPGARPIVLKGHEGTIQKVCFSPDSHWVMTSSWTTRVWDLQAKEPGSSPLVLGGQYGPVRAATFSGDSRWVLTAKEAGLLFWDLNSREPARKPIAWPVQEGTSLRASASPDGRWIATVGDLNRPVRIWDLASKPPVKLSFSIPTDGLITAMAFTAGNELVTGTFKGIIRVYDISGDDSRPDNGSRGPDRKSRTDDDIGNRPRG